MDFITTCDGERLNGPNDLSFDPDGNLYFTDPWTSSLEDPIGGVYGYPWGTGRLTKIAGGMAKLIIDLLEMVNIHHDQTHGLTGQSAQLKSA